MGPATAPFTFMDYLGLKALVAAWLHRSDLTATQIPNFILAATERINRRFNLSLANLVDDTDTNDVLTSFPMIYAYAAVEEGYIYMHNGDAATTYADRWEKECDRANVLQSGTALDEFGTETPYMRNEYEQELADAS